eukprot:CAMPEP_0175745900 /NCGR_PEP_ID=MMETSP0097-20121207/58316_1 /TAXON_ID=311494 /ORGANISM="Alexandrium monilatum, Strain CCMP3105" /LENGTH=265 /DNA_ID=CAMNT_0017054325 /DNA_START=1 /DNA_END=795 /DNA_ORIENTATION=+
MGYAGYSPGNNSRQAAELTPLQRALRALPLSKWQEALKVIEEVTRDIVRNPHEERLRRIDLSEPAMAASVAEVPSAVGILREMGWVDGCSGLVLPPEVRLTHQCDVVGIIEARDYYKKEAESERKRQMRARKSSAAARAAAPGGRTAAPVTGGSGAAGAAAGGPAGTAEPARAASAAAKPAPPQPAVPAAAAAPAAASAASRAAPPLAREPPTAELPEVDVGALSVRELKELLVECGLSTAGCVERADLVARVRASPAAAGRAAA